MEDGNNKNKFLLKDYVLLNEVGQGGYATVYKVRHNKLGYIRAVRVLNANIARGEDDPTYQKFLEECKTLLRLGNGSHPNIVHIYQPLLRDGRAFVEMDYVDGKDLYHYLEDNSSFVETGEVIKLLSDIGSALAYCHEDIYKSCMDKDEDHLHDDPNDGSKILIDDPTRQRLIEKYRVIHNDIHSGNIMRRENGSFVLLDFGLAIEGDSVVRSSRRKNGVPEFKAPEKWDKKWDNDGTLTTQSDIYSFGVVLYEFLAGRVPFVFDKQISNSAEAEYLLSMAHKKHKPEPIFALRKKAFEDAHPGKEYSKDYPDWLERVIMKCLEKEPKDRYKNGKELFDEVEKILQKERDIESAKIEEYEKKLSKANDSVSSYEKEVADYKKRIAPIGEESRTVPPTIYTDFQAIINAKRTPKKRKERFENWLERHTLFDMLLSVLFSVGVPIIVVCLPMLIFEMERRWEGLLYISWVILCAGGCNTLLDDDWDWGKRHAIFAKCILILEGILLWGIGFLPAFIYEIELWSWWKICLLVLWVSFCIYMGVFAFMRSKDFQ